MRQMTVPIDQAGRIVLAKDVQEELAIKPGDTLTVSIHGSSVTLTPNKEESGFVKHFQNIASKDSISQIVAP